MMHIRPGGSSFSVRVREDGGSLTLEQKGDVLAVEIEEGGYDAIAGEVLSQYVTFERTRTGIVVNYPLRAEEIPFSQAAAECSSKLERLALAQNLVTFLDYSGSFRAPLIHPDNIYVSGSLPRVVHCGLQGLMAPIPQAKESFGRSLRALVLLPFHPELNFDELKDGSRALGDEFSRRVVEAGSLEECFDLVSAELNKEIEDARTNRVSIPKPRYRAYQIAAGLGLVVAVIAGSFALYSQSKSWLGSAVVAAQACFLQEDYACTVSSLEGYSASVLPAAAKYVLASSSVELSDLSYKQKQETLAALSEDADANVLKYWIAIGRDDFEGALDLAQNVGDDQLILLAYEQLYRAAELDKEMSGSKKRELLDEYSKEIAELTEELSPEGTASGAKAGKDPE